MGKNWEQSVTVRASGAVTAAGSSTPLDLGATRRLLRLALTVTALAATYSLTVKVESSPDGANGWRLVDTFDTLAVLGVVRMTAIAPDRFVRVSWTFSVGGAPAATFGVAGSSGIVYGSLEALTAGAIGSALGGFTSSQKVEALASASEKSDGHLNQRYAMPLSAWSSDLDEAVIKIAQYELLSQRGLDPEGNGNIIKRNDDAMKWLRDVAEARISPTGVVDSTPNEDESEAFIYSETPRGW